MLTLCQRIAYDAHSAAIGSLGRWGWRARGKTRARLRLGVRLFVTLLAEVRSDSGSEFDGAFTRSLSFCRIHVGGGMAFTLRGVAARRSPRLTAGVTATASEGW